MKFDLASIVRRTKNPRRSSITFREIKSNGVRATDLYRAGYAPMLALWNTTAERVIAEYERTLAGMTTDAPADLGSELDDSDTALTRIFMTIRPALNRWALRVENWHRGKWRGAVLSATGVDIDTMIGPNDMRMTLAASIERNVALVKSVSEQMRGRIADSVFRGLSKRTPAREVANEIREAVGMGRRRALNIASDQMTKISSQLNAERRREAGIDQWEWRHSAKRHPRQQHLARNGKIYSDDDAPSDLPGELPYCGCVERAVLSID